MKLFWGGLLLAVSVHATIFQVAPQLGAAGNINGGSYNAGAAQSGVALLNFSGLGCSGVAIAPTVILTAAHCVTGPANVASAFFTDSGSNLGSFGVSSYLVHPSYTGDTLGQVDLALVYLTSPLAAWVSIYQLYNNTDEVGQVYQVAGWGERASNGGAQASAGAFGTALRVGNNLWDATFAPFAPFLPNQPVAPRNDLLVADFDDGTAPNNSWLVHFPLLGLTNAGVPNEVTLAPGDSGGPSFLGGRVAGITSFNATFDAPVRGAFGEFNGATRISSHIVWINENAGTSQVPEPASFGMVGVAGYLIWAMRRRHNRKAGILSPGQIAA